jgi:hypothetical protein
MAEDDDGDDSEYSYFPPDAVPERCPACGSEEAVEADPFVLSCGATIATMDPGFPDWSGGDEDAAFGGFRSATIHYRNHDE